MGENAAPFAWLLFALFLVAALLISFVLMNDKHWCTPGRVLSAFVAGVISVYLVGEWQWCRGIDVGSALLCLYSVTALGLYLTSGDRGFGKAMRSAFSRLHRKVKRARSGLRVVNDDRAD